MRQKPFHLTRQKPSFLRVKHTQFADRKSKQLKRRKPTQLVDLKPAQQTPIPEPKFNMEFHSQLFKIGENNAGNSIPHPDLVQKYDSTPISEVMFPQVLKSDRIFLQKTELMNKERLEQTPIKEALKSPLSIFSSTEDPKNNQHVTDLEKISDCIAKSKCLPEPESQERYSDQTGKHCMGTIKGTMKTSDYFESSFLAPLNLCLKSSFSASLRHENKKLSFQIDCFNARIMSDIDTLIAAFENTPWITRDDKNWYKKNILFKTRDSIYSLAKFIDDFQEEIDKYLDQHEFIATRDLQQKSNEILSRNKANGFKEFIDNGFSQILKNRIELNQQKQKKYLLILAASKFQTFYEKRLQELTESSPYINPERLEKIHSMTVREMGKSATQRLHLDSCAFEDNFMPYLNDVFWKYKNENLNKLQQVNKKINSIIMSTKAVYAKRLQDLHDVCPSATEELDERNHEVLQKLTIHFEQSMLESIGVQEPLLGHLKTLNYHTTILFQNLKEELADKQSCTEGGETGISTSAAGTRFKVSRNFCG